jgi:hypothetical protein
LCRGNLQEKAKTYQNSATFTEKYVKHSLILRIFVKNSLTLQRVTIVFMPRIRFYLIGLVALAALLMVGCAGGGTSGKRVSQASDSLNTEERMPSDTLYTEERAMAIFD